MNLNLDSELESLLSDSLIQAKSRRGGKTKTPEMSKLEAATKQLQQELKRLLALDRWIATGTTLIIHQQVCHCGNVEQFSSGLFLLRQHNRTKEIRRSRCENQDLVKWSHLSRNKEIITTSSKICQYCYSRTNGRQLSLLAFIGHIHKQKQEEKMNCVRPNFN